MTYPHQTCPWVCPTPSAHTLDESDVGSIQQCRLLSSHLTVSAQNDHAYLNSGRLCTCPSPQLRSGIWDLPLLHPDPQSTLCDAGAPTHYTYPFSLRPTPPTPPTTPALSHPDLPHPTPPTTPHPTLTLDPPLPHPDSRSACF